MDCSVFSDHFTVYIIDISLNLVKLSDKDYLLAPSSDLVKQFNGLTNFHLKSYFRIDYESRVCQADSE